MLAPPGRVEPIDKVGHRRQVVVVDPLSRPQGKIEPVGNDREMAGKQLQLGMLFPGGIEIVVGRDLQEVDAVAVAKEVGAERFAKPDSDAEHR